MRVNGTVVLKSVTAALDKFTGVVVTTDTASTEPIPCSILTNNDNRKGRYVDGVFHQSSYCILLEYGRDLSGYGRAVLERDGKALGEFQITSIEPLVTVGRIRILV